MFNENDIVRFDGVRNNTLTARFLREEMGMADVAVIEVIDGGNTQQRTGDRLLTGTGVPGTGRWLTFPVLTDQR